MMAWFVFVVASLMVLGGAVGVITRTHPVHAALSLILTLFGVAVHFVALAANFLAAVQVIVYAGAIVVLFLFGIMLLGVDKVENLQVEPFRLQRPVAVVVGAAVLSFLGIAIIVAKDAPIVDVAQSTAVSDAVRGGAHDSNIRALARDLFSDHVLAFELTSVLLVIAVVGTVVLARKPRKGELA